MANTIQIQVDNGSKRAHTNPYETLSEAELLEKLEKSRQNASHGKYCDASEISCNIREKYGL